MIVETSYPQPQPQKGARELDSPADSPASAEETDKSEGTPLILYFNHPPTLHPKHSYEHQQSTILRTLLSITAHIAACDYPSVIGTTYIFLCGRRPCHGGSRTKQGRLLDLQATKEEMRRGSSFMRGLSGPQYRLSWLWSKAGMDGWRFC